jgi:hypothetical protein
MMGCLYERGPVVGLESSVTFAAPISSADET